MATTRLTAALRDHRHLRGSLVLYQNDGSPLTEGLVQGYVRRAAQKAGLYNNGPHMLRHSFCAHLATRGAPTRAIQELAGHRDLTTTQRYMHLSPAALDSAIRLLDSPGIRPGHGDMLEDGNRRNSEVVSVEQVNWRRERESLPRLSETSIKTTDCGLSLSIVAF
jgi:integrase-like protein